MIKFVSGDRVDWSDDYKEELVKKCGVGPFTVRGIEDVEIEGDGHCQFLSIRKESDGKLLTWVSYKQMWLEDRHGPPFMAVPPTFSNIHFKKI